MKNIYIQFNLGGNETSQDSLCSLSSTRKNLLKGIDRRMREERISDDINRSQCVEHRALSKCGW